MGRVAGVGVFDQFERPEGGLGPLRKLRVLAEAGARVGRRDVLADRGLSFKPIITASGPGSAEIGR